MSNICWAFATAGHEAKAFFKAVAAQHERIARDGNEQAVANKLWSFAITGYLDEGRDLVEKLWKRVSCSSTTRSYSSSRCFMPQLSSRDRISTEADVLVSCHEGSRKSPTP